MLNKNTESQVNVLQSWDRLNKKEEQERHKIVGKCGDRAELSNSGGN